MTDELHPLLRDPEKRRAYDLLRSSPTGTERAWALAIGWKAPRVRRFIAALERQRLATVKRTHYGTRLDFGSDRSTGEAHPKHTQSTGEAQAKHLDTGEITRLDLGASGGEEWSYAVTLIEAMNEEFSRLLPGWRPVMSDNRSSHDVARRIRQAGVPLYRALEVLRDDCRRFNPSRHGRGEYPRSLAYFQKGILDRWRAQQEEIPLLSVVREPPAAKPALRGGKPTPLVDIMNEVAKQGRK